MSSRLNRLFSMAGIDPIRERLEKSFEEKGSSFYPDEPFRLVHGYGEDSSPLCHINIDYYQKMLLIAVFDKSVYPDLLLLEEILTEMFPGVPRLIQDRSVRPFLWLKKEGRVPSEIWVSQGGLDFVVNPMRGQNAGFFIDMRKGRELIRSLGCKRVLNLFSYTCSLSVAAAAGGAEKVVNIDMNKGSLSIGKRNHGINRSRFEGDVKLIFLPHDIFKSWGKLKKEGPYDLIIADPPPNQKGSFTLSRDYPRLLGRLPAMLEQEGQILLSLNSPEWNWEDFEDMVGREFSEEYAWERIDPPHDFLPREKGRGLKLLHIRRNT